MQQATAFELYYVRIAQNSRTIRIGMMIYDCRRATVIRNEVEG